MSLLQQKVELEHRGSLVLRGSNYVATGGEGSVYRASGTVVKLYTDPQKMVRDGMKDKISLLRSLTHPYVVAPEGLVFDTKRNPIGYYMPYADGEPLSRVFTNDGWLRIPFDVGKAQTLIERMRETVEFAHGRQALLADANELNWIVATAGTNPEPRAIDVDSWQIGKHRAHVIMPSIRDWHTQSLSPETDWFAWGVVTFQIFSGIHPYKGTLQGFPRNDLTARMQANASVFRSGVGLNRAVRDFNLIPGPLRDWYHATFEQGTRVKPPSVFARGVAQVAKAARILRTVTTATGSLTFQKLFEEVGDPVRRIYPCGVVCTNKGVLYDLALRRKIGTLEAHDGEVVRTENGWLVADWVKGLPTYTHIDDRTYVSASVSCGLRGRRFFRYGNRLFLITNDTLIELQFLNTKKPLLAPGAQTSILAPQATTWFDGVGIEEAMGARFMVLPFGEKACVTVRAKELDDVVPVSARAGERFATVVGLTKAGEYTKLEFVFTADYRSYQVECTDVDSPEVNVAILPKGVAATIPEDGKLLVFVPTNGQAKEVPDSQIATDMLLAAWDNTVVYEHQGAVWRVSLT